MGTPPVIIDFALNGESIPHVMAPVACPEHSHIISYSSSNATNCTASGAWSGPQPLQTLGVVVGGAGDREYTLTCTGPGGEASATMQVVKQVGAGCP